MQKILAAMALTFGIVFCVGLLLGPIRVLWLEPGLGPLLTVVLEMPLLLSLVYAASLVAFAAMPALVNRESFLR